MHVKLYMTNTVFPDVDQNYQVLFFLGWNAIDITVIVMIDSSQKAIKLHTISTLPDSIYIDLLDNQNDVTVIVSVGGFNKTLYYYVKL